MELKTWKDLRTANFFVRLFPERMIWANSAYGKATSFIQRLLDEGVKLDDININDFMSSIKPSVYVGRNRYSRMAKNDYKLALKHLKNYERI